jgi:hypothetical protein
MKVMVCGGRDFDNYDRLANILSDIKGEHPNIELISGGAKGADNLAEQYAQLNNVPIKVIKADWGTHGKSAGIIRNRELLDLKPNLVIAFWDWVSKGTKDSIEEAKRRGIEVRIHNYEPKI